MEVDKEEIPDMQNRFQCEEDEEETSLGKRKIDSFVKIEDGREGKRIAFSKEPLHEEEEDIDMIEATEKEDHRDNNENIIEDTVLEEEYVVDFNGFF